MMIKYDIMSIPRNGVYFFVSVFRRQNLVLSRNSAPREAIMSDITQADSKIGGAEA